MERKNRENLETKQNRTLRKCGTISKDLTYLYLESHRRQDRELSRQCIWRNNVHRRLHLVTYINLNRHEVLQASSGMNMKKTCPRHIIVKTLNAKDRKSLERRQNKTAHYLQKRNSMNFSSENIKVRKQWTNVLKVMKENNELYILKKLSFKNKCKRKPFSNKGEKLRKFISSRPALQEMLKKSSKLFRENITTLSCRAYIFIYV